MPIPFSSCTLLIFGSSPPPPQVEPYRSDNARLVQENTKLHQQLIRLKESAESRVRDIKATLRKLEHENADLKFLNTQYMRKMKSLEKDSQAKSEKLLALHQKSCEAVIQTPGGRKKPVPLRRQRMQIDSLMPEDTQGQSSHAPQPKRLPSPDPYVADLLQVSVELTHTTSSSSTSPPYPSLLFPSLCCGALLCRWQTSALLSCRLWWT